MKTKITIILVLFIAQLSFAQVAPLLKTNWGQGCGFNTLMPTFNNVFCNKAPVGCTGVTLSQIMKYWQFPNKGKGFFYYEPIFTNNSTLIHADTMLFNWETMGDTLNQNGKSNLALQQLMYKSAIICRTNFGLDESGGVAAGATFLRYSNNSNGLNLIKPLLTLAVNFGYSLKGKNIGLSFNNFNLSQLETIIKQQLDNNMPVDLTITRVSDGAGHSVVVDGYKNTNPIQFHLNCGWNGVDNGYYSLDKLNFPETGLFNYLGYSTNIKPRTVAIETVFDTLFFENFSVGNFTVVKNFFISNNRWTITSNDSWINLYNTPTSGNPSASYDSLYVYPNRNMNTDQRIGSVTISDGTYSQNVVIVQKGTVTGVEDDVYDTRYNLTLSPNPVNDVLHIKSSLLPTTDKVLNIYNMQGTLMKSISYTAMTFSCSMEGFMPGVYIIQGIGKPQKFIVE